MWISKKGRLKYSESNSFFVYLAEKGGNFANFKNFIFFSNLPNVVPITGKTDKVFELELFVCYSWIVFLVNRHNSGKHGATRFLENTLEFMRDVSFRYLRII